MILFFELIDYLQKMQYKIQNYLLENEIFDKDDMKDIDSSLSNLSIKLSEVEHHKELNIS